MGLSVEELKELLDFIHVNNSWENMCELSERHRRIVKYVNFSLDTRDNTIWSIRLHPVFGDGKEVIFRTESGYNLKDKVYEWLNTPLKNK